MLTITPETRTADVKGRITLGERFANKTVIIQEIDETSVSVTLARVIPEREAWVYENVDAKASVISGIKQARDRQFTDAPDMIAAAKLADLIENDDESKNKLDARSPKKLRRPAIRGSKLRTKK